MYKKEFDNLLSRKNIPRFILMYGECNYQNNLYAKKILESWCEKGDEVLTIYYDEYDFGLCKNHLGQSSLFGGQNILHVKSDKVIPKKELTTLIELCNKNENNFFLYQYFGDQAKAKTLSSPFNKNFVRFFKPYQNEALTLLDQEAKQINLEIDRYALTHLYMIHLEDLSLCVNEFQKLLVLNKKITTQDIDRVVYGLGSVVLDEFVENLLQKVDIKEAFVLLEQKGGVDEVRIVNAIQAYLSTLCMFSLYIKAHGRCDAKEIIGYSPPQHIINKKVELCKKIDLKSCKNLLLLLNEIEYTIKKSKKLDKSSYLTSSLIKLQSFL